jgi:hypothetical protein
METMAGHVDEMLWILRAMFLRRVPRESVGAF